MMQKKKKILQHIDFDDSNKECEVCMLSKMEKPPFKQKRTRAERPLQLIHTDVMGVIIPVSCPGHKKYIVVFVDDFSRYAKIYSLKRKDEAGTAFKNYLMTARNLLGRNAKVCYVRSDRGTEFTGGKFVEVLKAEKIELDCGPPSTPPLNGVAERFNKTIQRTTRALMCDSGLPTSMWEVAADAAVHYYNITPYKSIKYEVPLLKFSPRARCNFEYIKRFGCIAYAKLSTTDTKFSNVSIKSVLVGHTSTGYILWHPSSRKFLESKHVNFTERFAYKDVYKKDKDSNQGTKRKLHDEIEIYQSIEFDTDTQANVPKDIHNTKETISSGDLEINTLVSTPRKRGRSKKVNSEINTSAPTPRKRGRPRTANLKTDEQNLKTNTEKPATSDQGNKRKAESYNGHVTRRKTRKVQDISFARYTKIIECEETRKDVLGHMLLASLNKDPIRYEEAMNSADFGSKQSKMS